MCKCDPSWRYYVDSTTIKNMGGWQEPDCFICLNCEICPNGHLNSGGGSVFKDEGCWACLDPGSLLALLRIYARCPRNCQAGFLGLQHQPCPVCNIGQPQAAFGIDPSHYKWSYLFIQEGHVNLRRHASSQDRDNIVAARGKL
jgi:hypothetical protein